MGDGGGEDWAEGGIGRRESAEKALKFGDGGRCGHA